MSRLVTATAAHKAAAIRKRIIVFPPCECVGTVLVLLVGEPRTWSGKSSSAQGNIRERHPRSQHTKPWQGPAKPWQGPGKPWQGPGEALRGRGKPSQVPGGSPGGPGLPWHGRDHQGGRPAVPRQGAVSARPEPARPDSQRETLRDALPHESTSRSDSSRK